MVPVDVDALLGEVMESLGASRQSDPELYQYLNDVLDQLIDTEVSPGAYSSVLQNYGSAAQRGSILSPPGTTGQTQDLGAGPDGGETYETLKSQFGVGLATNTRLVGGPGDPVLRAVSSTGKLLATYTLGEDGRYYAGGSGAGGGAGTGGTGDPLAGPKFDRSNFESDRDYEEAVRQFNAQQGLGERQFGEGQRQFDQSFGEGQRQFDLGFGQNERQNLGNLGVQLGNLNLQQQKYVSEILRNPSDFLTRAFLQRGGQSPFPEVTQADLINKLRSEFSRTRDFVGEQLRGAGGAAGGRMNVTGQARPGVPGTPGAPGTPRMPVFATGFPQGMEDLRNGPATFSADDGTPGFDNPLTDTNPSTNIFQDTPEVYSQDNPDLPGYGIAEQLAAAQAAAGGPELQLPGRAAGTMGRMNVTSPEPNGPVRDKMAIVGEEGPEMLINHGDGSFDIMNNPDLRMLMENADDVTVSEHKDGTKSRKQIRFLLSKGSPLKQGQKSRLQTELKSGEVTARAGGTRPRMPVSGYAGGTLDGLTPDDIGTLGLFDTVDTTPVTQDQLLNNARLATPPGVAAVAGGRNAPDLDVTKGSSFSLFSPQQYQSLTPDEQEALGTRLASENKSLGDFLFQSQRTFAGRPRQRPRARMNVLS